MSLRAGIAAIVWVGVVLSVGRAKPPDLPAVPAIRCDTDTKQTDPANKARELYRKGEYYLRTGYPVSASLYYQQVRRLCPNGHYGRLAAERLTQLGVVETPAEKETEAEEGSEEQSAPVEGDGVAPPVLPAVDPGIIGTLEELLGPTDDSPRPGYRVRIVEESNDGPTAKPDGTPPTLYIDSPQTDLRVSGGCPVAELVRQIVAVVEQVASVEVDDSRPGRLPARFRLQLGSVGLDIEIDAAGHGEAIMGVGVGQR
jgi:hypothetical protein